MCLRPPFFFVRVRGESMWPVLVPGRRYLATTFMKARDGDIVVADTPDGIVVKRVVRCVCALASRHTLEPHLHLSGMVSWSSAYVVSPEQICGVLVRSRCSVLPIKRR